MKRKMIAFMTVLTLSISLSACGKDDTFLPETKTSSNSDAARIEELEKELEELKTENKELMEQLENQDSTENATQQATNEAESLLKTTVESPETSGVCGADLTWYYLNGVLAITGTGEMTDYSYDGRDTPWYDLKDKIGWVIIDDGVTTIGDNAFSHLSTLSKVKLSIRLTTIGSHAFSECYNIKEINLPNTLEIIGSYAFSGCYNIEEINLPNSITNIEDCALATENITIVYNGQTYTEEEFASLAEGLDIGNGTSMFGWEKAAESPSAD